MKCPKCQANNPETVKFCGECGAELVRGHEIASPKPPVFATKTMAVPADVLTAGSVFADRYQVIEELGRGGMGSVYRVFDRKLKEEVALKLIKPEIASDRDTIERFGNELRLARRIGHRNVGRMYELMEAGDAHFITMEYVPGEDLKSFIRRAAPLSIGKSVAIARQVCEGLTEAHRLGVVHRDLKPSNVMIDKEGNARIMDFGIARSLKGKGITGAGVMIGTPEYMSPEQAEAKEVDQRSDIYTLGVILFEMLTGRVPFEGDTPLSVAIKHKTEPAPDPRKLNAQIPDELSRLILRCMEKDRARRHQSADEVLADLGSIESGIPTAAREHPKHKPFTSKEITVKFSIIRLLWPALIVTGLVVASLAVWKYVLKNPIPLLPEQKRSIAVISFENQTGDKNYDFLSKAIPDILITRLEQSGYLSVTTWDRLQDLLKQVNKPDVDFIDKDLGLELCRLDGAEILAQGSFIKTGEMFAINVRLLDVATNRLLKMASSTGEGETSILKSQIDQLSKDIARGVGVSDRQVAADTAEAAEMTTSSPTAYKLYMLGQEYSRRLDYDSARTFLEKAVAIDPDFAMAYHSLFWAYLNIGRFDAARQALDRARDLSEKLGEKERLYIEASYVSGYAPGTPGDPAKQERILLEITNKFPKDKRALKSLGSLYLGRGENEKGAELLEKAIAIDPNDSRAINDLALCYQGMGKPEKGMDLLKDFLSRFPDNANLIDSLGDIYFLMGQIDQAITIWKDALAIKPDQLASIYSLAYVYALREEYPSAISCLTRSISIISTPSVERYLYKAFFDYWLGNKSNAFAGLDKAVKEITENKLSWGLFDICYLKGWMACDSGEVETGERYFDEMTEVNKSFSGILRLEGEGLKALGVTFAELKKGGIDSAKSRLETLRQLCTEMPDERKKKTYLRQFDLLSAEILLREGEPQKALQLLEQTVPFEALGLSNPAFIHRWHTPQLPDVRARAYVQMGKIDKAIAEYERLTTFDPKSKEHSLIHPLFHYRLGKLYEQKGLKDKAKAQYERFLDLWKDADSGHPEVEDAKKRLQT